MGSKRCTKCQNEFPATVEFFSPRADVEGGLTSWCRECLRVRARARMAERRANDPDFRRRQNEACNRLYHEVYKHRPDTKERGREAMRRWRQRPENLSKERDRMRALRSDPEFRAAENLKKRAAIKQESYRLSRRAGQQRYKARKLNATGSHTKDDILRQYSAQHGLCWWCGESAGEDWQADHLVPLSRGGSNAPENIVIACRHCNQSKNNRLPHEWIGRLL